MPKSFRNNREYWQKFSDKIDAKFIRGNFWRDDKVIIPYRRWTIVLDTYTTHYGRGMEQDYTRVRVPFIKRDDTRFKLYRRTILNSLTKLVQPQQIATGNIRFDREFVLTGNNESKVKDIFSDAQICELIQAQIPDWGKLTPQMDEVAPRILHPFVKAGWFDSKFQLQIKTHDGLLGSNFPENVHQLHFEEDSLIIGVERLKSLYGLFTTMLDRLHVLGVVEAEEPQVTLE